MSEQSIRVPPGREVAGARSWGEFLGVVHPRESGPGKLLLPYRERHLNAPGAVIHGGIIATLLHDSALDLARSRAESALRASDCQISFLRAARETDLHAGATVLRLGREFSFVDSTVSDDAGRIIAASRWALTSHGADASAATLADPAALARGAAAGAGLGRLGAAFNRNMDDRVPGLYLEALSPGRSTLTVPDAPHLRDVTGDLAPGILLLAADNSAVFSCYELVERPRRGFTVQLALTLCEPVSGEDARVLGESVCQRGDLAHNSCAILGARSGRPKAFGTVSFIV
ncbi:MAG TPA: hotdog fold thioesterase [Gammaproteobacteria bacterium]|nr:hotdog fold thioesterase [Gammaproteobacteria bacterium]